jgi:hypothetical protein
MGGTPMLLTGKMGTPNAICHVWEPIPVLQEYLCGHTTNTARLPAPGEGGFQGLIQFVRGEGGDPPTDEQHVAAPVVDGFGLVHKDVPG